MKKGKIFNNKLIYINYSIVKILLLFRNNDINFVTGYEKSIKSVCLILKSSLK